MKYTQNYLLHSSIPNEPSFTLMTPGPTSVSKSVRHARSIICTNPDVDLSFVDFYKETCQRLSSILNTDNESLILSGEGILGLEAACATLTQPGDRVLVLDNGIYGNGFKDFVSMYGGEPVLYTTDYHYAFDIDALKDFLEKDHNFKYATVVHCDTPSGMLNDISKICPLLKSYGILTVVDSVSAMFGEPVDVASSQIDILCGGSQKALSCPTGLTFVTISDDAKIAFHNRKTPVASFYANLTIFDHYYENKWFPYTMPVSDIYGFRQAIENVIADTSMIERHKEIATYVRENLTGAGYELYGKNGYSNTVTAVIVPDNTTADELLSFCFRHGYMLSGSFGPFAGKLIRIGHMGENARMEKVKPLVEMLVSRKLSMQ